VEDSCGDVGGPRCGGTDGDPPAEGLHDVVVEHIADPCPFRAGAGGPNDHHIGAAALIDAADDPHVSSSALDGCSDERSNASMVDARMLALRAAAATVADLDSHGESSLSSGCIRR